MIHSRAAVNEAEDADDASVDSFARGGDTSAIGAVALQRVSTCTLTVQ
jgi:hypothetical protein